MSKSRCAALIVLCGIAVLCHGSEDGIRVSAQQGPSSAAMESIAFQASAKGMAAKASALTRQMRETNKMSLAFASNANKLAHKASSLQKGFLKATSQLQVTKKLNRRLVRRLGKCELRLQRGGRKGERGCRHALTKYRADGKHGKMKAGQPCASVWLYKKKKQYKCRGKAYGGGGWCCSDYKCSKWGSCRKPTRKQNRSSSRRRSSRRRRSSHRRRSSRRRRRWSTQRYTIRHLAHPSKGVTTKVTLKWLKVGRIGTISKGDTFQVSGVGARKWKACRGSACHTYRCKGVNHDHICIWGVAFKVQRSIKGRYQVYSTHGLAGYVHQDGCDRDTRRRRRLTVSIKGKRYPQYFKCETCSDGDINSHVHCKSCGAGQGLIPYGIDHKLFTGSALKRLQGQPQKMAADGGRMEGVCVSLNSAPALPRIFTDNSVAIYVGRSKKKTLARRRYLSRHKTLPAVAIKLGVMATLAYIPGKYAKKHTFMVECDVIKYAVCSHKAPRRCTSTKKLQCSNICLQTEANTITQTMYTEGTKTKRETLAPGSPGTMCPRRPVDFQCTDYRYKGRAVLPSSATKSNLCSSIALLF